MSASTARAGLLALASACVAISGVPVFDRIIWIVAGAAWAFVFVLEMILERGSG